MTTSLADIITDCRRRVDMKVNQFWTDTDFTSEINKSLAQLDMILISKFSDYKLTAVLVSTVGSTNLLALPSDFLKMRGLDVVDGDGYVKVSPFNFKKRTLTGQLGIPSEMMYRLQGTGVYLLPADSAPQYQYRLWYTPDFIKLVDSTDTLESYMDSQAWYEYAVVDTCAKCLAAQDLNPQVFQMQKEELKDMITKLSAPNRDAGEPIFITNERGDGGYGYDL